MVVRFQQLWKTLGHHPTTTSSAPREARHERVVQGCSPNCSARGEIYLGDYEGWYCVPDERFWTDKDAEGGRCPDCGRELVRLSEENYFFRLGSYREWLLEHIEDNPGFIQPESRRNEMLGFLRQAARRPVHLPAEKASGLGHRAALRPGVRDLRLVRRADQLHHRAGLRHCGSTLRALLAGGDHLIGKDILRFHAVYWPTDAPRRRDRRSRGPSSPTAGGPSRGARCRKSLGNVVDPGDLVDRYGVDPSATS